MPELQPDNIDFLAINSKNKNGLSTLYYPLDKTELMLDINTVKIMIKDETIETDIIKILYMNVWKLLLDILYVPTGGLEPPTTRLKVVRSAN